MSVPRSPVPNEEARSLLASLPDVPPLWERDLEELRASAVENASRLCGEAELVARVEDVLADGVPARLYLPGEDARDALVWIHGGGWIRGSSNSYDSVTRALANSAKCAVLSIDYRLAPEHRYPAAFDDAWAAMLWTTERFENIAVGGDSSGGNLAAAVALKARDRGVKLALQLLVYPVLDYGAVESSSYDDFSKDYENFAGIKGYGRRAQEEIRYIWDCYVPDTARRTDPFASPLRAESLTRVAPAVVITPEHDILRGEAQHYARRLAADGVPVEVVDFEGQIHGFFAMLGVMSDARRAINYAADELLRAFGREREGEESAVSTELGAGRPRDGIDLAQVPARPRFGREISSMKESS